MLSHESFSPAFGEPPHGGRSGYEYIQTERKCQGKRKDPFQTPTHDSGGQDIS